MSMPVAVALAAVAARLVALQRAVVAAVAAPV